MSSGAGPVAGHAAERPLVILAIDELDVVGGVQRVVRTLADHLVDRGHRVELLGLEPSPQPWRPPVRHDPPATVLHDHPSRLLYEPRSGWERLKLRVRGQGRQLRERDQAVTRLRQHLAARPGAVLVLTQLRIAEHALAALDGAALDVRVVLQHHCAYEATEGTRDMQRLHSTAAVADVVQLLNEEDEASFRAAGLPRTSVMRNPVELPAVTRSQRAGLEGRREQLVVAGGRYHPEKAFDVLLRAWALVAPAHPGWSLEVWGDGPDRADLEALAAELGVAGSARLMGPTDDFGGQLERAAVCVLSSPAEGMGLVLAEAMARGLPCASTDAGAGVRDLVDHGRTGLLSPRGDPVALAASLEALLSDAPLRARMGAAGRSHVQRYDAEAVLDAWEVLLASSSSWSARASSVRSSATAGHARTSAASTSTST